MKREMISEELVFGTSELFEVMAVHQEERQVVLSVHKAVKRKVSVPTVG
jgi:hypothetical protein